MGSRFTALGVAAAGAVALVLHASVASANFRGTNGLIAFDAWTGTSQDIGVFDPRAAGAPTMLTSTPDFSEHAPRWSPDGTKIVYMGHPQADRSVTDIWVMDADGQHKTQLTSTPVREEVPAWTSDGRIVYCGQSQADPANWDIYLMNADGSGITRLTSDASFECWPSPAPSGQRLAFTSDRNGIVQLFTMKLDGTAVRPLTAGFASDWSPSGNEIVFLNYDDDPANRDVWAIHSDGTGLKQLTNTPGRGEAFPTWSADATQVVFGRTITSGVINIFGIDLETGTERMLLADSPPTTYSVAYPTWQPVAAGGGPTSLDPATRTAATSALRIQWSADDPEEIVAISWRGSPNLTNTAAAWWCQLGDNEFFGNSWTAFNNTDFAMPVGGGTTGTWSGVGSHRVTIASAASGCFGTSGIPVNTQYTLFGGSGTADRLRVQRTFDFGTTAFDHSLRPYIPRLYPSYAFGQVVHPDATGTTLLTESSGACEFGCLVTNWNGTWFAIHDPATGRWLVVRHVSTDYQSALWVDQDGASGTTSSSVALLKPSDGFNGKLTDVQDLCFYDSSIWTPTLTPPQGC